ncbi:MAG: 3-oxo-tetronate kinase [Lachnospiraceae bacterium]
MKAQIVIGCIADDFTGASDAASFLAKAGLRTVLINGIPEQPLHYSMTIDAVVIALKTRTQEKKAAVSESVCALNWLIDAGAEHLYSKYCSTFDSTPQGNIGPILDAALECTSTNSCIVCPALPVNKRTVKNGCLYVDGVPLHQSSMKDHPLTPMWESDIEKLMAPQSNYPCVKVDLSMLRNKSKQEIWKYINSSAKQHSHFYIIPDYCEESDAKKIAEVFGDMRLLSGGSGVLTELGIKYCVGKTLKGQVVSAVKGKALILAGSCSTATLQQIEEYKKAGKYCYRIDPVQLADGSKTAEKIWDQAVAESAGRDFLIYSSAAKEQVQEIQKNGPQGIAAIIEATMARLAVLAYENKRSRIIVAGGETSGAVTRALSFSAYYIGASIAPGVPIMAPLDQPDMRLVLKSGNFGQPDFFIRALNETGL